MTSPWPAVILSSLCASLIYGCALLHPVSVGTATIDFDDKYTGAGSGSTTYLAAAVLSVGVPSTGTIGDLEMLSGSYPLGTYTVSTWLEPCSGTCDKFEAPIDHCSAAFELTDLGVRLTIRRIIGEPCTISVAPIGEPTE